MRPVCRPKRLWVLVFIAMLLAVFDAVAGTTATLTGFVTSIENEPQAGVRVTVTAPVLIGSRKVITDARGFYRIPHLPPGDGYVVRFDADGFQTVEQRAIRLHLDETIKLPPVQLQRTQAVAEIEVIENPPVVSQGTTTGIQLTHDFLLSVPIGNDTTSALQLAPGATSDGQGSAFRGASSPENHYVIDGVNTTGIELGLDTTTLPLEFVQEIQIKTGGYDAEYGRATGAQAIVVTRSGGNSFHGDVFLHVTPPEATPDTLVSGSSTGVSQCPDGQEDCQDDVGKAALVYLARNMLIAQPGFDLGGYIVPDRLWFFIGFAPSMRIQSWWHEYRLLGDEPEDTRKTPPLSPAAIEDRQYSLTAFSLVNLTWKVTQDHSVRLTASGNPVERRGVLSAPSGEPGSWSGKFGGGSLDFSATYTGRFLEGKVALDAIAGYHTERYQLLPFQGTYRSSSGNSVFDGSSIDGANNFFLYYDDYPVQEGCHTVDGGTGVPCTFAPYARGGKGVIARQLDSRLVASSAMSIFLDDLVGSHLIKLGGDFEHNRLHRQRAYTGGFAVIATPADSDTSEETVYDYMEQYQTTTGDPILWHGLNSDASYRSLDAITDNSSAFIQDNWSLLPNLQINLGVRWERQQLRDAFGITRIDLKDNVAPRLGLLYDFTQGGRSRLFANFGRYYESVPLDINARAMSVTGRLRYCYSYDDYPDYTPGSQPPTDDHLCRGFSDSSISNIQKNLKGQYSDQYLLGFEYEVIKDLSAGVTGVHSTLGNVIEDISPDNGATYVIANPGTDAFNYYETTVDDQGHVSAPSLATDPVTGAPIVFRQCIAAMDPLTGAPKTYCYPKASRTYKALELVVNKRYSDRWAAQFSYVLSRTYGNYPGLFARSKGQLDPNITAQFDLANLMANRDGDLDNDRRHVLKLSGAYQLPFGTAFGVTASAISGLPILYLGAHPYYGGNEAFVLPRGVKPVDAPDGISTRTPWVYQLDVNLRHELALKDGRRVSLGLQVDNVLNRQDILAVNLAYTNDVASPASGGTSLSQVQCYKETSRLLLPTAQCTPADDFGNASSLQAPRAYRLDLRYSF